MTLQECFAGFVGARPYIQADCVKLRHHLMMTKCAVEQAAEAAEKKRRALGIVGVILGCLSCIAGIVLACVGLGVGFVVGGAAGIVAGAGVAGAGIYQLRHIDVTRGAVGRAKIFLDDLDNNLRALTAAITVVHIEAEDLRPEQREEFAEGLAEMIKYCDEVARLCALL
jgi:hypothetical protein